MSSATRVPQTRLMSSEELSADDARATLRRVGRSRLLKDCFTRFRYADGFSSARALGFQFVLSFVPLVIAVVGLSSTVQVDKLAEVLRRTLLALSPGTGSDAVEQALASSQGGGSGGQVALVGGLVTALVALTTSMGQVERASNRIYGIQRDRPSTQKYVRAAVLALCAGVPAMLGFLLLVAGGAAIDSFRAVYGEHAWISVLSWARFPVGALLGLAAITILFRWSPRRRQPGESWIAFGSGVALVLWLAFTGLLALYITSSGSFGEVYGPLTGIVALLLWSQLTSVALLLGVAFNAQLEAVRAGVASPAAIDPELLEVRGRDDDVVVLAPDPAADRR